MENDRRRFSRLAPCQDGCRLANAGCLVLSNPVSLTATVCVELTATVCVELTATVCVEYSQKESEAGHFALSPPRERGSTYGVHLTAYDGLVSPA